ncbi:MAG: hypothetical protein V1754_10765 [Pseudomonadota bacterium]
MKRKIAAFVVAGCFCLGHAIANETGAKPPELKSEQDKTPTVNPMFAKIWNMTKLSMLWYLTYSQGREEGNRFNKFHVGRGYVTVELEPVSWFEPRVTVDTHQNDEGDWSVRLKYLYGKFVLPMETSVISEPNIEAGLVHTPWFDYEENVNNYRMEDAMFIERNQILNSADLGVMVGGLIGKKLSKDYQERVSKKYPGKYGSFALGFYNGGGYHAKEQNNDKVFMSRLSLRPLGFVLPHLQVSYFFIFGKGNTKPTPDWYLHDVMLSFEYEYIVLTGQYAKGAGDQTGSKVNAAGEALDLQGFSFFAEVKLPWIMSSIVGRFDYFDWDTNGSDPATSRLIAGYAFHFYKQNFLLLSMDRVSYEDPNHPTDWQGKLTLQVKLP